MFVLLALGCGGAGSVALDIESAEDIAQLCADGWITPTSCQAVTLGYEFEDQGHGWFQFRHHNMHVSYQHQD